MLLHRIRIQVLRQVPQKGQGPKAWYWTNDNLIWITSFKTVLVSVLYSPTVQVVTIHDSGEIEDLVHKKVIHKPIRVDRCRRNEVWYSCLPCCPITCDNLYKSCKAPGKCLQGCDCKRGYARRSSNGPCERIDRCPCELKRLIYSSQNK